MSVRSRRLAVIAGVFVAATFGSVGTASAGVGDASGCTGTYAGAASGDAFGALPGLAPPPYIGVEPGTPKQSALDLAGHTVDYVICVGL